MPLCFGGGQTGFQAKIKAKFWLVAWFVSLFPRRSLENGETPAWCHSRAQSGGDSRGHELISVPISSPNQNLLPSNFHSEPSFQDVPPAQPLSSPGRALQDPTGSHSWNRGARGQSQISPVPPVLLCSDGSISVLLDESPPSNELLWVMYTWKLRASSCRVALVP